MMKLSKSLMVLAFLASGAAHAALQSSTTNKSVSYDTMNDAAKAGIEQIYSISKKIEYVGFIVEWDGKFYLTSPFTSNSDDRVNMNVKIMIPKGSKIVAYYHIHPDLTIRGSVNRSRNNGLVFSDHDIEFAHRHNMVAFVGIVANNTMLRYDPQMKISLAMN